MMQIETRYGTLDQAQLTDEFVFAEEQLMQVETTLTTIADIAQQSAVSHTQRHMLEQAIAAVASTKLTIQHARCEFAALAGKEQAADAPPDTA